MVKVRGYALADPTVVGLLEPFLVVSWAGFDVDEAPSFLKEHLWPEGVDYDHSPDRSNVYVFLLDSRGRVAHVFDPRPSGSRGHWDETYGPHFISELREGIEKLALADGAPGARVASSPGEDGTAGRTVRIVSALEPRRTAAYNRPIVELQPIEASAWDELDYPDQARRVDAGVLESCLAHVYPPGIVFAPDGGDPASRLVRGAALTLSPAGRVGDRRYAVLTGTVELEVPGGGRTPSVGNVEIVLGYDGESPSVRSMRGIFLGWFSGIGGVNPFDAVLETVDDWTWE